MINEVALKSKKEALTDFLTYFKVDANWKKKFIIGGLVYALYMLIGAIPIIGIIIAIGVNFILCGQVVRTTNTRILKPEKGIAAFGNLEDLFTLGLKNIAGYLTYTIPYLIVSGGLALAIFSIYNASKSGVDSTSALILSCLMGFCVVGFLCLTVLYVLFTYSAHISFCFNLKFKSYFNVKRINELKNVGHDVIVSTFVKIFIIALCFVLLMFILSITVVGIVLAPFLAFYVTMLIAELNAKCAKKITLRKAE